MNIIDLSSCVFSMRNGAYGGRAGDKEGIIYNGENWIVKYPKNTKSMKVDHTKFPYTTAPLSEYIGSHIYSLLGLPVHETILGFRNGKIVVACKDFTSDLGELLEIRTVKNTDNDRLSELYDKDMSSTGDAHSVDFAELMLHLRENTILSKVPGIKERFWDQVVVDGFIGNNDRNNGNWGIVCNGPGLYEMAPIFDNGGAFYSKLDEDQILDRLNNKDKLDGIVKGVQTIYSLDGHQLTFKKMLEMSDPNLTNSIRKLTPVISNRLSDIDRLIDSIPECYSDILVCSATRKEYYKTILRLRVEYILRPAYTKLQVISKDRVKYDLLNFAQSQGKPIKDVVTELSQLIPSTYNSEKYSYAVRAWVALQIQEGHALSERDLIKLKELSNE